MDNNYQGEWFAQYNQFSSDHFTASGTPLSLGQYFIFILYLVDKPIQKMLELRFSTLFYFQFLDLDFRIFNQLIVNYHRDSFILA